MPSSLVLVEYFTPVTSFATKRSAPTMTLLAGSSTRPLMVPLGDCASVVALNTTARRKTWRRKLNLTGPLLSWMVFILPIHSMYGRPSFLYQIFLMPEFQMSVKRFLNIRDGLDRCAGRRIAEGYRWVLGSHPSARS